MKEVAILGAAIAVFAVTIPAAAQDAPNRLDAAVVTPQPTEQEATDLRRCIGMTPAHRAQSSRCTDLMARFALTDLQKRDLWRQGERRGRALYIVTHD